MSILSNIRRTKREGARLDKYFPAKRYEVDHFYYGGQSNMLGQPNDVLTPVSIAPGMAFSTREDQTYEILLPDFTGKVNGYGTDRMGSCSPAFGIAAEWSTYTSRRAVHTNLSWSGSPLLKQQSAGALLNWEVTEDQIPYSLLRSPDLVYLDNRNRENCIPHADRVREAHSGKFKEGYRFYIWAQGEAEAQSMATPGVTAANYTAAMQRMWDWLKETHRFNYMGVLGLGRRGDDETEVTSNEPGHSAIRQAQIDFVDDNPDDVFLLFANAHDLGSPFNTFTVDGNGLWTAGAEYADGVHWTGEYSNAMGRYAARQLADAIGI